MQKTDIQINLYLPQLNFLQAQGMDIDNTLEGTLPGISTSIVFPPSSTIRTPARSTLGLVPTIVSPAAETALVEGLPAAVTERHLHFFRDNETSFRLGIRFRAQRKMTNATIAISWQMPGRLSRELRLRNWTVLWERKSVWTGAFEEEL